MTVPESAMIAVTHGDKGAAVPWV